MRVPPVRLISSLALPFCLFLSGCSGDKPSEYLISKSDLKTINDKLDGITGLDKKIEYELNKTNDTPIKVRGGAMTFVVKGKKWHELTPAALCAELDSKDDLSNVRVEGFAEPELTDGPIPAAAQSPALSLPQKWTLKIYGGDPKRQHGVELISSPTGCSKDSTKPSVTVKPFGGSSFYSGDMGRDPQLPSHKYYKRFYDTSCSSGGIDEDLCERITGIAIVDQDHAASPAIVDCLDLDCTVRIGKP